MTKNFLTNEKKQSQVVALVCIVCVCVCVCKRVTWVYLRASYCVSLCVTNTSRILEREKTRLSLSF